MFVSKAVYFSIFFTVFWIFTFRLACSHIDCITNILTWNLATNCDSICEYCEGGYEQKLASIELSEYLKIDSICKKCKQCKPDWNLRAGLDTAGLSLIALCISSLILYLKNISLSQFVSSVDTISLFGGTALKLSKDEEAIDDVIADISDEVQENGIKERAEEIIDGITKRTDKPYDQLFLLTEKIQELRNKIYNSKEPVNNDKSKQIKKLEKVIESFLDNCENNKVLDYTNKAIKIARKIIIACIAIIDYLSPTSKFSEPKYRLNTSLGTHTINTQNDSHYDDVIPKGQEIPYSNKKSYSTLEDDQEVVRCIVYHTTNSSNTELLSEDTNYVEIDGLPKKKKGQVEIFLYFKVDKEGKLLVQLSNKDINKAVQKEFDVREYIEEIK